MSTAQKKKSICFDALNIKRGGGVTVAHRLIASFARAGWEVHVILSSQEVVDLFETDLNNQITIHFKPKLFSVVQAVIFRHTKFEKFAKTIGAQVILSFNFWTPSTLPQVTYHVNVIPFLPVKQRQEAIGTLRGTLQYFYSKKAIQDSHLNMFESQHILDLAKTRHKAPISNPMVRYIGIDIPKNISPQDAITPAIITVTSGARHKNNDRLIDLHKKLAADGHGIGLVIGGFGKEKAIRASLTPANNDYIDTQNNIRFLGYCTREELYQELASAIVLVSFSELESFFMVPIEAMAVGCPTITTNVSSIKESVGDAGIVVNPGDVDSAADWVKKLLEPSVRQEWSSKAKSWANRFDSDECADAIVSSVDQLLDGANYG